MSQNMELVTYKDICESCSQAFRATSKNSDPIEGLMGWSGSEYNILTDGTPPRTLSRASSSSRLTATRRNKSATPHSRPGMPRIPKKSISTHDRLPTSGAPTSDYARKTQILAQSSKNLPFEFVHFEKWEDHMEHYRNSVTNRVQQKFIEYHAPGMTVRRQASLHEKSDLYAKKLLNRQQMVSPSLRNLVQPDQIIGRQNPVRVKMTNLEMTPKLTPHRLPTSKGDRNPAELQKGFDQEAYRQRMELLGNFLHRRTPPSIQNIKEPTIDHLKLRVSTIGIGGVGASVTNPPGLIK